jgi:hypothetical protein
MSVGACIRQQLRRIEIASLKRPAEHKVNAKKAQNSEISPYSWIPYRTDFEIDGQM